MRSATSHALQTFLTLRTKRRENRSYTFNGCIFIYTSQKSFALHHVSQLTLLLKFYIPNISSTDMRLLQEIGGMHYNEYIINDLLLKPLLKYTLSTSGFFPVISSKRM